MQNRIILSNAKTAARNLLGGSLVREYRGEKLISKIVETEAYLGEGDITSHSYRGQTPRNSVMFGPAGVAYVYFTYGMHYCFNVVTGKQGRGEAVLIRALEPIEGVEVMQKLRHKTGRSDLCNGPAKLCRALAIDKQLNGHKLTKSPLWLESGEPVSNREVVTTNRIGVKEAKPLPLRFYIKDNEFVSKK